MTIQISYDIIYCVADEQRYLGGLAQLGEHLPYKQEVTGSSPVVPTRKRTCISKSFLTKSVLRTGEFTLACDEIRPCRMKSAMQFMLSMSEDI